MSYQDEHPTLFCWRPDVKKLIDKYQDAFPYKTFANTYYDHPPKWHRDTTSVDFWGGGLDAVGDRYLGYRGKPLPEELGKKLFNMIFNDPTPPAIWWTIYRGKMWVRGEGWQDAPDGPSGTDPGHWNHIHVTYVDW